MQCTNCGNEVPDAAKVCGYCGHRLKAGAPVKGTISQPVSSQRGMPGWAWGLIGGLLVITGLAVFTAVRSTLAESPVIPPTTAPLPTLRPLLTNTPTKVPTQIPMSPTPDFIMIDWDFDEEDIPEIDFEEYADDSCSKFFYDGEFHISVNVANIFCRDWTYIEFSDGYIETKARIVESNDYGDYGLIFYFYDGDNYYIFSVNNEGYYKLSRKINDEWNALIGWTYSEYINTGTASNELGVRFTGREISVYINTNHIDTFTFFDDGVQTGSVGVVAGTGNSPNIRVAFDYFYAFED